MRIIMLLYTRENMSRDCGITARGMLEVFQKGSSSSLESSSHESRTATGAGDNTALTLTVGLSGAERVARTCFQAFSRATCVSTAIEVVSSS